MWTLVQKYMQESSKKMAENEVNSAVDIIEYQKLVQNLWKSYTIGGLQHSENFEQSGWSKLYSNTLIEHTLSIESTKTS